MQEMAAPPLLCELRFDISLTPRGRASKTQQFESAWRAELAAQKKTTLAMPPAQAVAARFRLVGPQAGPELRRYLLARLAALPGSPSVASEPEADQAGGYAEWAGVQIWLSYSAADLPALLRTPPTKGRKRVDQKGRNCFRGHRP